MIDAPTQYTEWPMEEEWISVAGMPIHFVSAGTGPAMVLIHGQGENWATWRQVMPALARTHRVIAIDMPGSGKSGKPASVATPPAYYSDFLAAFLDAMGLARVILVGNSHGGLVALRLALAAQHRIAALCLVDSAALGRETNPLLMALALPFVGETVSLWCQSPWGAAQWTWMLASLSFARPHRVPLSWYTNAAWLARVPGHLMGNVVAPVRGQLGPAGQREVLLDALPELSMPTLIMWGIDDRVVPHTHGKAAVSRLRHGKLVLIPDCGHLPQAERPAEFVAGLVDFLDTSCDLQPVNAVPDPPRLANTAGY